MGDVLGMATMLFADEVVPADSLDELPDGDEVKTTKRELDIAKQPSTRWPTSLIRPSTATRTATRSWR